MRLKLLAILLTVLLAPALAWGQDAPNELLKSSRRMLENHEALSLADLEAMALQRNPSLAVADARYEAAQGRRLQAGLYPNPVIGYQATEMGIRDTAGQQGGFISQRFVTAGKLRLNRAVADQEVQQAQFQFEAQKYRVLTDVRIRFYEALVAQRRIEITKQLARIGRDVADTNEKLLAAQQGTTNNLLQAQIEADTALILFENAENQHRESWRRLCSVIGQPAMQATPLMGHLNERLPNYRWQESLEMVLSKSPELHAAHARIERAEFALQRAWKGRIPDVDVMVAVRHHNFTTDDVANVQVGFPLPIFNANQGNIRRARADLVAAQNAIFRIELDLQDRMAVAFRRYANARQQVDKYNQRILQRADKSLDLVTTGYRERQVDYLTLLITQKTYFQVNLAYLDAVRELRISASAIEGQLLQGSLTRR